MEFKAGKFQFPLGKRTYIMGILNVTPDSFSDGGKFLDPNFAVEHALQMQEQGADIIDIGAQSTRPGYTRICPEEEWERLAPVLGRLQGKLQIPLSIDTFYPQVAKMALQNGVCILNDVTGFSDVEMFRLAASCDCGCIMMHHGEEHDVGRENMDVLYRVRSFFEERLIKAQNFGIPKERICFDPGIGFGKSYEENLKLIANVEKTKIAECAYLMAASRKRVIGQPCGNPPFSERLSGTIAAHTIAAVGGANILRVHDVPQVQAARVMDALLSQKL